MGLGDTTTILYEDANGDYVAVSADRPLPTTGGGGGGGGAVNSVNGATGTVVLDSEDIQVILDGQPTGATVGQYIGVVLATGPALQGQITTLSQEKADKTEIPTWETLAGVPDVVASGADAEAARASIQAASAADLDNVFGIATGAAEAVADLATVATSGDYNDLDSRPELAGLNVEGLASAVFIENGGTPPTGLSPYTLVIELEA